HAGTAVCRSVIPGPDIAIGTRGAVVVGTCRHDAGIVGIDGNRRLVLGPPVDAAAVHRGIGFPVGAMVAGRCGVSGDPHIGSAGCAGRRRQADKTGDDGHADAQESSTHVSQTLLWLYGARIGLYRITPWPTPSARGTIMATDVCPWNRFQRGGGRRSPDLDIQWSH